MSTVMTATEFVKRVNEALQFTKPRKQTSDKIGILNGFVPLVAGWYGAFFMSGVNSIGITLQYENPHIDV